MSDNYGADSGWGSDFEALAQPVAPSPADVAQDVTYERLPRSWGEMEDRLALAVGGPEDAREWLRQALEATWGVQDVTELGRRDRALALQRASGTMLRIVEEHGDLDFGVGVRAVVRAAFARHWHGVSLEGPPWRLDPTENDRPAYHVWAARTDFEAVS